MTRLEFMLCAAALAGLVSTASAGTSELPAGLAAPPPAVVYPSCPPSFHVIQKAPHAFVCRQLMSRTNTVGFALAMVQAQAGTCAPTGHWNVGPEVVQGSYGGNVAVSFRCRHM